MRAIEWVLGVAMALIALYLLLVNPKATSDILSSLGTVGAQLAGTLQGRSVSGGGITIGGFQR